MPLWAFVSNDGSSEIQVVDLALRQEVSRIPVSPGPFGLALTPDQLQLWVPLDVSRSVAVICTPTASVLKEIPLSDPGLVDLVMAPDGQTAFGLSGSGVLYLFDVPRMAVKAVRGIGGEQTERIRLTPDGSELWVVDEAGEVVVVSTANARVLRRLTAAQAPADVAFSPDGQRAYIPDMKTGELQVVDRASGKVRSSIALRRDGLPRSVAVAPDGRRAYVCLFEADQVLVVDLASEAVTGALHGTFDGPNGIAISPDGALAVVVNEAGDRTGIIDLEDGKELASLPFPGLPRRVVIGDVPAFEWIQPPEEATDMTVPKGTGSKRERGMDIRTEPVSAAEPVQEQPMAPAGDNNGGFLDPAGLMSIMQKAFRNVVKSGEK